MGNESRTIVIRPDGSQIITVVDRNGRLIRRIRRDPMGRENHHRQRLWPAARWTGLRRLLFDLPPPVIRIPQDRYIVDAQYAAPALIYQTLMAPPVERIERRYSLDEIRYSPGLRERMPSIDLDTINFDLGSWTITPEPGRQAQRHRAGLNDAISRNPREVFLIEGHTDATGNDTDNLSLSDRRAEAAAELLTSQFQVPAENLTSQGYGSQVPQDPDPGTGAAKPACHGPAHHAAPERAKQRGAATTTGHVAAAVIFAAYAKRQMAGQTFLPGHSHFRRPPVPRISLIALRFRVAFAGFSQPYLDTAICFGS